MPRTKLSSDEEDDSNGDDSCQPWQASFTSLSLRPHLSQVKPLAAQHFSRTSETDSFLHAVHQIHQPNGSISQTAAVSLAAVSKPHVSHGVADLSNTMQKVTL